MASPDNNDANRLCVWLLTLMEVFVEEKDLGEMFVNRSAFRLDILLGTPPGTLAAELAAAVHRLCLHPDRARRNDRGHLAAHESVDDPGAARAESEVRECAGAPRGGEGLCRGAQHGNPRGDRGAGWLSPVR